MKHFRTQLFATAILLLAANSMQAQSLKDIFSSGNLSNLMNTVTGKGESINMVGNWKYCGSAVELESDNILQQAGGALASTVAETKLNTQLAKLGIKEGQLSFVFNADSTFTSAVGKRTMSGTYSYNPSTKKVSLRYLTLLGMSAKVDCSSDKMTLLFDAKKLLKLLTLMGSKSNSTSMKTISALAKTYDGMLMGFDLKKSTK